MRLKLLVSLLSVLFIVVGCRKKTQDGYMAYTIKSGKHSSVFKFTSHTSDVLKFDAIFDSSAIYDTEDPVNQYDINKLYGFSECNQHHQNNSARFGWRWLNGKLEIHGYVYNNGERLSQYITSVSLGESHTYQIRITDDWYLFRVDNELANLPRTNNCDMGLYYMLYPYFGGDETAPHDIKILIKQEKSGR